MINNGSLHYDHDRDGTHTELAGCEVKVRNLPTETHVLIRYTGNTLTGKLNQFNLLYVLKLVTIKVTILYYNFVQKSSIKLLSLHASYTKYY